MNTLKRVLRVASTALTVALVLLAVALVGVRLVGFEVFAVLSGSMEPTYHVGSLIWVQEREPEEVQVGDPITYVLNEDLDVVTHRVIEIDAENSCFYTQGDANDSPDGAPVHFENLVGVPVFTVPYLGYFVSYIQQPPGMYVAVAGVAFVLLLALLPLLFAEDSSPPKRARQPDRESQGSQGRHARTPTRRQAQPRHQPRSVAMCDAAGSHRNTNPSYRVETRGRTKR